MIRTTIGNSSSSMVVYCFLFY